MNENGREEQDEEEAWVQTLDELDARVQDADASGDPRAIATAYTDLAEHLAGVADREVVMDVLLAAREACLEFDPDRATELVQVVGLLAHSAADYATAAEAFGIACDELSERDDPNQFAGALNDYGTMCTQIGEFDAADKALVLAEEMYLRLGLVAEAAEVRLNLANNHRTSGRRDDAERTFRELVDFFGEDTLRGAMCLASLAATYVDAGGYHLAVEAFDRAIQIFDREDEEAHATETRMSLATVLLLIGEVRRGEELLSEAIRYFDAAELPYKVAMCEYNRANAAAARHDFVAADRAFEAARTGLAAAGMHHHLANLEWNRVKRLLTEAASDPLRAPTLGAEAVDTAVASLIAGDYQRFQFTDAWRRAQWKATLAHRITWTFILARQVGSVTVLADLIETVLSAGVYGLPQVDPNGVPPDLGDALEPRDDQTIPPDTPSGFAWTHGLGATLLSTAELPMAPPPALIDGDGRLLLARQREIAAKLDPYLAEVLRNAPRVPIW
ncbi:tetratricopeptide repeat protein [Gordonia alkanivorans]|uniref:tetratricopeptide repeat protein n=1 Tax=Gordonia alkanivorans TaxID=84096 RepID=UPI001F4DCEA7|nr:tetratricopeptide repeat protein [Gordonia alkanivorans]